MPVSAQAAHIDGPLSQFSIAYLQDLSQFAGSTAFPTVPVAKQSDRYHAFDLEAFLTARAKQRAENTEAAEGGFGLSQDSYFCDSIAIKYPITDEARSNADESIELEQSAVEGVTHDIAQTQEMRMAAACFVNNVWWNGTGAATTAEVPSSGDKWSGTSSPLTQIKNARRMVLGRTGIRPNRLLLGQGAWDALESNEQVIDLISGGATTGNPAIANRELVARALGIERVDVAGGVAMAEGASNASLVVDDAALLYYAPASGGRRVASACTRFIWRVLNGGGDIAIKQYREEAKSRDAVEGHMFVDFKVTGPQLGFLWNDVVA